jgi:hypothetical protein
MMKVPMSTPTQVINTLYMSDSNSAAQSATAPDKNLKLKFTHAIPSKIAKFRDLCMICRYETVRMESGSLQAAIRDTAGSSAVSKQVEARQRQQAVHVCVFACTYARACACTCQACVDVKFVCSIFTARVVCVSFMVSPIQNT